MARKKKEEGGGGSPAWMATFSDLMNLLLCFFVLLFAFSSVDAEAFAEIAASFSNDFSIFTGGARSLDEGSLISQGISQMEGLSSYFSAFGAGRGNADEDTEAESDQEEVSKNNSESEAQMQEQSESGEQSQSTAEEQNQADSIEQMEEKLQEEQKKEVEALYDEVAKAAEKGAVEDEITLDVDDSYQYVKIIISGAILFESGQDEIVKGAKPVLNKVGDILKNYDKNLIKIVGHTDNVPISGKGQFESNMWLSEARATRVFEYLVDKKKLDPATLEASGRGEFEPVASNKTPDGRAKNRRVEIQIYTD
ncbi:MAG: flagellar motor protein MotB [Lachnospiraceae bacterium]|nr:flagellar motor protein MotB [Lachnospiraceae bacterium]